ncbi:restriction endonuclease subunit S [Acidovorax sp. M2(2025)]|uniref:restriction endonuclease subunit S n=1 Tax=Acidovorax sp. M2(2025) TaxID=3411355 RepID=UPI003BF4783D
MSAKFPTAKLTAIAELNPTLGKKLPAEELVSFVPMASLSAESASVETTQDRSYAEVAKGFTPFLDGDVLVAKITPCFENGKIAQARLPRPHGFGSTEFHVVRARSGVAESRYLHHYLRLEEVRANGQRRMTGSGGQRRVPASFLADLAIPLPPLEEQRRIAAILDQAETLRTQRRTALALLDSLTQSLFLNMFGDPVTNPKKLPLFRGDEICSRITVGIVVQPSSYYRSEGVPALRSLNIRPNKVVMENLVYFSSEDNETKLAKTRVRKGDVLLVRTGQPGTAAVVPPELDGVNAIDILIATPDTSKVLADYLCYFFNSDAGKKLVLGAQRGQVQKHLNVGAMNAALIPIPPLPLQQTFATRIASIEALKATHRRALAALDALVASLQQRAFTGAL